MGPLQHYRQKLACGQCLDDPAQTAAVEHTETIFRQLQERRARRAGWRRWLPERQAIQGLYLWGGVGRGKTLIMDNFYACLPAEEPKRRTHFHRFMQSVHKRLAQFPDTSHPLRKVAAEIRARAHVLCLDEFHVEDITDAMLLSGLLENLFAKGVVLFATSNEEPDQLYRDGLQRDRFLPAIALLRQHTTVTQLASGTDYRLHYLDHAEIYHTPLDERGDALLREHYAHLSNNAPLEETVLEIHDRNIPARACRDEVAWFDFSALCEGPRGVADYIELARCYNTVLLQNVPVMGEAENEAAKRFIRMVDEFYDRRVKLILTAAALPDGLYRGNALQREFRRTCSRLQEMRSHSYLGQEHLG